MYLVVRKGIIEYMVLQNLHTHTCYCDGANTPEEIVVSAIDKGLTSVGFSGHSYMKYSPVFASKGDKTIEYKREISHLKEKYKDIIEIYLGLEVEMYSDADMKDFDYLIGSVHYLKCGNSYVDFDRDEKNVEFIINHYFDGDGMKYAKAYYNTLAQLPQYGDFDIVGHFDLITKFCEKRNFFDISSNEYMSAAIEAAEALAGKIPLFELNTGAVARGYRTTAYPEINLIKELKRLGFGVVITSDCHNKEYIDCNFKESAELLKACGFKEQYILTQTGFVAVSL